MTSQRRTLSNQGWNNVVDVNIGIYNIEQRRINVVYFDVDLNNVRKRFNNVVIFIIDFRNVGQLRKNGVNVTIFKKLKINFEPRTW